MSLDLAGWFNKESGVGSPAVWTGRSTDYLNTHKRWETMLKTSTPVWNSSEGRNPKFRYSLNHGGVLAAWKEGHWAVCLVSQWT
ncbi:hypothetical protein DSO57_1034365 [Entomophthora muscae]|uniref:Uncharacterized protein n=1 Tax=Entomophthora muscae TaxID=34485 RepID=A0ACC2U9Z1_9FUNG|nr:hypothetical protein DSO57_1034365 [Entomophthora muscae]